MAMKSKILNQSIQNELPATVRVSDQLCNKAGFWGPSTSYGHGRCADHHQVAATAM